MDNGTTSNPLVYHCIEQHGGQKSEFIAVITKVEASALYRVCRKAVQISNMPGDSRNMNRCMEWGAPRVPVLAARGGDHGPGEGENREPGPNPRPDWSNNTLPMIKEGKLKRIRFWEQQEKDTGDPGSIHVQKPQKRLRLDVNPEDGEGAGDVVATGHERETGVGPDLGGGGDGSDVVVVVSTRESPEITEPGGGHVPAADVGNKDGGVADTEVTEDQEHGHDLVPTPADLGPRP